jgi:hypothetical protein
MLLNEEVVSWFTLVSSRKLWEIWIFSERLSISNFSRIEGPCPQSK